MNYTAISLFPPKASAGSAMSGQHCEILAQLATGANHSAEILPGGVLDEERLGLAKLEL